jgi:hypothetical protein
MDGCQVLPQTFRPERSFARDSAGWTCGVSHGFGPLDGEGSGSGIMGGGLVHAAGSASPGSTVTVKYRDEFHDVHVDEFGLWAFVRMDFDVGINDLPQLWAG